MYDGIHSGPLLRPRGQKMRTDNMDSFAKQCLEHHFSIRQTCIPANKGKADAVWVKKSSYVLVMECSYTL